MVWRSSSDLSTLLLHLLLCNLRLIFECAKTDPSEQSFDAVRKEIAQIQFLCSEMEPLWRSISAKSQRDIWKRKTLNGDSSHVLRIFGYEAQAMQSARRKKPWQRVWPFCLNIVSKGIRAQRKALDVLNTLGLSNSVMTLIEKRNRVDRWIKYAGMVLMIVILIFIWRWTR
ncbi:hypothetical protein P3S68_004187 [Capsicum galapagoense]